MVSVEVKQHEKRRLSKTRCGMGGGGGGGRRRRGVTFNSKDLKERENWEERR